MRERAFYTGDTIAGVTDSCIISASGVGDVQTGAVALAADYYGTKKASYINDKLIEMQHQNETLYACSVACSAEGCPIVAGSYLNDLLSAKGK